MIRCSSFFHLCPLRAVIAEFIEMGAGDFADQNRAIADNIRHRAVRAIGALDILAGTKPFDGEHVNLWHYHM